MAAGGPWSVKGIAPQAREAAKDAARREGKTLGEWLNEIILETGDDVIAPAPRDFGRDDHRQPGPQATLDALARRLESAEHRSTLAITGIDQSVRGLLARLETTERVAGDVAQRADGNVSELHHAQSELAQRLAALESDTTAQAGLEAAKTLENALAQVAGHVHDRDQRNIERAGALEERLEALDARIAKATEDLSRRVDAASDHATMQAMRATGDLRQSLETQENRTTDTLASLEASVSRLNQRLAAAESLTDNAMRSLEASFAHLDDRLRTAEQSARETSAGAIAETLEQKFESLGRELRERIDQVRDETARSIAADAPRLDRLERALEKANKRNTRTLGQIGDQIGLMGAAVERRLEDTERRLREDAIQDRSLETRLREVENASADAIRIVAESVDQISQRLAERIEASERRNTDTVATLGQEMAKLADRLTPQARDDETLATRLRESERRTQQMIRDAVAGVSAKLDAVRDESESGLSPVQSALANLAGRLEAIESGAPVDAPPVRPAPPRPDTPRALRSSLPPAEDALTDSPAEDEDDDAGAPEAGDAIAEPAERPAGIEVRIETPAEAEEEIAIDPPARPNPFMDDPEDEPETPEPEAREPTRPDLWVEAPAGTAPGAARETPPLGATADSSFLAQARRATRSAPGEARPNARGSVLEAQGDERAGNGRRVLVLAGLLATVTLGAAAWLLFLDGQPGRAGGSDPAVLDMLNGAGATPPAADGGQAIPTATSAGARLPAPPPPQAAAPADAPVPTSAATLAPAPAEQAPAAAEPTPEPMAATPAPAPAPTAPAPAPQAAAPAAQRDSAPAPQARIISGMGEAPAAAAPQQAAGEDDPTVQYQLGEARLQVGDAEAGVRLIGAAAAQGYAPAQYRLGKLYETGANGLTQDDTQARLWTERAATAGNRSAMHNLALMYAEGRGGAQDDVIAAQWFERAAQVGATDSQFNLAVLYEQGRGVPQSMADAYAWYRIAERAGDAEAGERANLIGMQLPADARAEADSVVSVFQPRGLDPATNASTAG